jgi:hypothetical protein
VEPGRISATYQVRVHTVQVSIPYTAASYDIVYDGSDKMKVLCPPMGKPEIVTGDQACPGDQRPVRIHPNYKTWIDELNTMIVAQLGRSR